MSLTRNQTRKTYSFKSSGKNKKELADEVTPVSKKMPIGIRTPVQLSKGSGLFDMHTDLAKQVSDNLRNLILTNHGERLGLADFGANLRPLTMEMNHESFDVEAGRRINAAVSRYMPYVTLINFAVFPIQDRTDQFNYIGLRVEYVVPKLSQDLKGVEIGLLIGG